LQPCVARCKATHSAAKREAAITVVRSGGPMESGQAMPRNPGSLGLWEWWLMWEWLLGVVAGSGCWEHGSGC
jgi:hypothetical protein